MRGTAPADQRCLRVVTVNPSRYGLKFHHFGLALRDLEPAATFLAGIGYEVGSFVLDEGQMVRVAMCHGKGLPPVEIVLSYGAEGPLSGILKRHDALFYHSCFTTEDAEASLAKMMNDGLEVIPVSPPKPAPLFDGRSVSFHYVSGFGLIELLR
jgi:Glyoxalase/Bleomycin resistance protein/Dioxygenase superfamily